MLYFIQIQTDGDTPGRIIGLTRIPEENLPEGADYGISVPSLPDALTSYYADGEVKTRPTNPVTLGGNVMSGLPIGSKMTISVAGGKSQSYDVAETSATLDFPLPGNYSIRISNWPMLDKDFQITI